MKTTLLVIIIILLGFCVFYMNDEYQTKERKLDEKVQQAKIEMDAFEQAKIETKRTSDSLENVLRIRMKK